MVELAVTEEKGAIAILLLHLTLRGRNFTNYFYPFNCLLAIFSNLK